MPRAETGVDTSDNAWGSRSCRASSTMELIFGASYAWASLALRTFVACFACKTECSFSFMGLLIGVPMLLRGCGWFSVGVCDEALEGGWKGIPPPVLKLGLTRPAFNEV